MGHSTISTASLLSTCPWYCVSPRVPIKDLSTITIMPAVSRGKPKKNEVEPSTLEDLDPIIAIFPTIFSQVQNSVSNHKKNIVALRKIQENCSLVTETSSNGTLKLVGEKVFNNAFIDMVNRTLPIKKGVSVADRVVQFVGKFVAYTIEQGKSYRPRSVVYS